MNRDQIQRRAVGTLMVSTVVGYAGYLSVVAVAGLLAAEMLGSDRWAGLPSAAATLGTALAAAPLALRSRRKGRRQGLSTGYLVGFIGALIAILFGQGQIFWLLVVGMVILGVGQASNLQSRFAAADLADEHHRARAIALVVWVSTVGAVVGPPIALWANRVGVNIGLSNWVAPFVIGAVGFGAAAAVVGRWLRPDPLETAGGVDRSAPFENPIHGIRRSWAAIWPNRMARLALVAMAVSQMAMVAVMTMTPLYMRDHGQADMSTLVISAHVFGMYSLSPLVGRWADRFGRVKMIAAGAGVLGAGTTASVVAGYLPVLIFVGLFLLGLGWSFALIAGSALLTESLPMEERVGAQGLADVAMSVLGATAAMTSGLVKDMVGYHWLANLATVSAILILAAAMTLRTRTPATVA